MNLRMPSEGLDRYNSASQRARISSESWAAREPLSWLALDSQC